jgi:myotubularin-related protein 1/2
VYDAKAEWDRQFESVSPKYRWRVSDVNKDYAVCPSYPKVLCFPPGFDPIMSFKVAEFRDACRIPTLSYVDPDTMATISRCAQPLPGRLGNKRCEEDELLISSIFKAAPSHPKYGGVLMDARPYQNAVANRALGAGFEKTENYMNCQIEFLGIDNIHVMRDSLEKVKKLARQLVLPLAPSTASGSCTLTQSGGLSSVSLSTTLTGLVTSMGSISLSESWNWFSRLADTNWLRHICSVIGGAARIAHLVHLDSTPVVVHCSHGWDRTSQLVAAAQIMLDPFYRTLRGFQVLIEKDWISFGFKFYDRCHSQTNEVAPIFLQFVRCIFLISADSETETASS